MSQVFLLEAQSKVDHEEEEFIDGRKCMPGLHRLTSLPGGFGAGDANQVLKVQSVPRKPSDVCRLQIYKKINYITFMA